jgi:hypothetical protein
VLDLVAPQVGLEPTTLRLTARNLYFPALLMIAIPYLFSMSCSMSEFLLTCGDYPQLLTILRGSTHKSPHSKSSQSPSPSSGMEPLASSLRDYSLFHVADQEIRKTAYNNSVFWTVAYRAIDGSIWFGGSPGLWHIVHEKESEIPLPPDMGPSTGGYLHSFAEDRAGELWVSFWAERFISICRWPLDKPRGAQ